MNQYEETIELYFELKGYPRIFTENPICEECGPF